MKIPGQVSVKSLLAKQEKITPDAKQSNKNMSHKQVFYQGLLGNLLNPKAILFLLAFFTLVIKPDTALWVEFAYGFEIAFIHMIWFSSLAFLLTHRYIKTHLNQIQFYIVKAMGAVLVAFGVRIATLHQTLA